MTVVGVLPLGFQPLLMTTATAGVALGLIAAFSLTRWLSGLLFNVRPADPKTLGAVAVLLILVTLGAAAVPARRAAATDPMAALRQE